MPSARKLRPDVSLEREGEVQHAILGIHIVKEKTQIECDCGWRSTVQSSESKARKEYDRHVEQS